MPLTVGFILEVLIYPAPSAHRLRQSDNVLDRLQVHKGVAVARKRLIIEMGMGIDQHGQQPTVAAARAVRNAIAHNALPGIWEVAGLSDPDQMIVEVKVAVPYPEQVREA
ncbi:MAG TPA: Lin0512 family protein, partial [Candidatus Caenarcaniphilales bacterium]